MLAKVAEMEQKQAKQEEREQFRKSHKDLRESNAATWQKGMTAHA